MIKKHNIMNGLFLFFNCARLFPVAGWGASASPARTFAMVRVKLARWVQLACLLFRLSYARAQELGPWLDRVAGNSEVVVHFLKAPIILYTVFAYKCFGPVNFPVIARVGNAELGRRLHSTH